MWTPVGSSARRADLLIEEKGVIKRVQCKTGRIRNNAVVFHAFSTHRIDGKYVSKGYANDVDFLAVYCPDNDSVYLVPAEETISLTVSLRLSPATNGQKKRIKWADNFKISKRV